VTEALEKQIIKLPAHLRRSLTLDRGLEMAHHAERGDFSRWVRDVFADVELARQFRKVEARWRRRELGDLRRTIDTLITVRYGGDD